MGKKITWVCDQCNQRGEGYVPPDGWIQATFFNIKTQKFQRYELCCYACLTAWAESREQYYQNKFEKEQVKI